VEQALVLLERAVSIDPGHAHALAALAWAYGFRSIATTDPADLDRAITYAERAIDIDSENSEAHMWRGYVLLRRGAYADAARACRRASELAATNARAPYFAGSALLFGGGSGDALPYLQRSLELDGNNGMGWLALGTAHLSQQHLREAQYSFRRALDLEGAPVRFPTAGAAAYVGEVLRLQGDTSEARDYALRGLEAAERSDHAYRDFFRAHALVVLGRTALDQADILAAVAAFRQVLGQAEGRPQTRSCGQLVVQALAGLARATQRAELIIEGQHLFDTGQTYNFEPFFGALHEGTLFELAAASHAIGLVEEARAFLTRARGAGSMRSLP
jgi:tetratricopeptide (TPR) repeat protein